MKDVPTVAASEGDKATISAINYNDIPHTQIRKVYYYYLSYILIYPYQNNYMYKNRDKLLCIVSNCLMHSLSLSLSSQQISNNKTLYHEWELSLSLMDVFFFFFLLYCYNLKKFSRSSCMIQITTNLWSIQRFLTS